MAHRDPIMELPVDWEEDPRERFRFHPGKSLMYMSVDRMVITVVAYLDQEVHGLVFTEEALLISGLEVPI